MLRVTLAAAPAEQGGHFTLGVFYGNARIFLTPPPCMPFVARKMATLRNILRLARRSCHWGPIIALSLVTIVTSSSTYCLFQLSVLPNVVVFKSVHNVVCYSWIALILKNFFQVCACFCAFCVYIFIYSALVTLKAFWEWFWKRSVYVVGVYRVVCGRVKEACGVAAKETSNLGISLFKANINFYKAKLIPASYWRIFGLNVTQLQLMKELDLTM